MLEIGVQSDRTTALLADYGCVAPPAVRAMNACARVHPWTGHRRWCSPADRRRRAAETPRAQSCCATCSGGARSATERSWTAAAHDCRKAGRPHCLAADPRVWTLVAAACSSDSAANEARTAATMAPACSCCWPPGCPRVAPPQTGPCRTENERHAPIAARCPQRRARSHSRQAEPASRPISEEVRSSAAARSS